MDDGVEAVGALALIGIARHQQNGQIGKVARRGKRQRDAVHDRHADVGEQKIETAVFALEQIERVAAVACGLHLVAGARERARAHGAQGFLVFGDQDASHDQRVPANMSLRLTKRTSTSWESGGGEASRVWNATASPGGSTVRGGTAVQE